MTLQGRMHFTLTFPLRAASNDNRSWPDIVLDKPGESEKRL